MSHSLQISGVVALFVAVGGPAVADDEVVKIDGRWKVASVHASGTPVPGLAGSELVLAGGKKVFTLPDGRIETGTYRLNRSTRPAEIDSTTEGRNEPEKGIYSVDGDSLKLCLATSGGPRPRRFAAPNGSDQILIVLRRVSDKPTQTTPPQKISAGKSDLTRGFRMGFTGFVHDITLEAVTDSRKFVRENGDILAHHIEGVPWGEAFNDQPFPPAMIEEWKGKKSAMPPHGRVYLAISPGRGDLKLAEKAQSIPRELAGRAYDGPRVMKAYLNYCRRAIEFFDPDYLAIGIEVNEIHDGGPEKWQAYATLHAHIYTELKKEHPDLPIFASWTLHNLFKKRGTMLAAFEKLMPYNDIVAVSYYPFFMDDEDRLPALEWMIEHFDAFQKPYAVAETNDAAERLPLPQAGVVIQGTEEKQLAYYRRLLSVADEHEFVFVISFVHQDYDALWEKIKGTSPEFFVAWRDCGLLDETGRPRPAYDVWTEYFRRPLSE